MTTQICINVLHGASNVGDDDRERAENAALAVIEKAGTTPQAAYAEYQRQWLEFDDRDPMTGLALVWIEAESAADVALTEGWHNPDGASCTIAA